VKKEPESPRNNSRRERSRSNERRDRDVGGGRERKKEHVTGANREPVGGNPGSEFGKSIKKEENGAGGDDNVEKEGVNLQLSGALTKDTNTFNGVVIKYSEPPEARKPKRRWRFYVFKGEETLPTLHLHRQSAFLMGRDRKVCDLPIDHPSCSKQHAVFQYRMVGRKRDDGSDLNKVLPYIIDLGSANGTYLNNQKIEAQRYVELKEKDVLKFGYSSREYVLLHENSDGGD